MVSTGEWVNSEEILLENGNYEVFHGYRFVSLVS